MFITFVTTSYQWLRACTSHFFYLDRISIVYRSFSLSLSLSRRIELISSSNKTFFLLLLKTRIRSKSNLIENYSFTLDRTTHSSICYSNLDYRGILSEKKNSKRSFKYQPLFLENDSELQRVIHTRTYYVRRLCMYLY